MMSSSEHDDTNDDHIKSLVLYVLNNEVSVKIDDIDVDAVRVWLLSNVGQQRPFHPYNEALSGWLDYFDGDWAVATGESMPDGQPCLFYWFYSQKAAAKFILLFGGIPSISNSYRNRYLNTSRLCRFE